MTWRLPQPCCSARPAMLLWHVNPIEGVWCHATERAPRRGHLDHHHSLSPASNLATSSPPRSTASWVSAGDDTATELSARAI